MTTESWRTVAEYFALANRMKIFVSNGISVYEFNSILEHERNILSSQTFEELVGDPDRRVRFAHSIWTRHHINLDLCWVWPEVGGDKKASGNVPEVAKILSGNLSPKLLEMTRKPLLYRKKLPLIVFLWPPGIHNYERTRKFAIQYDIDDGSHRAVALWLANYRSADAFVGIWNDQE
jgi:hypothetical protein